MNELNKLRYYINDYTVLDLEAVTAIYHAQTYNNTSVHRGKNEYEVVVSNTKFRVIGTNLIAQYKKYLEYKHYDGQTKGEEYIE